MGRVRPSTVMLAIQKLSTEEKKEMAPAFETVYEALQWVMGKKEIHNKADTLFQGHVLDQGLL